MSIHQIYKRIGRKIVLPEKSDLMQLIEIDIEKSGGWYMWRDIIILENSPHIGGPERRRLINRLNHHTFKNTNNMQLSRSNILETRLETKQKSA